MEEPPTGVASPIAALAQAVTAAVLGTATPPETLQLLHSSFRAARSFRLALPVGQCSPNGIVFVSDDLRLATGRVNYWAAPREQSLVGSTLELGRTAALEGPPIHQLKDSDRLWALEGSSSFLCVPVLAEGGGGGGCGDWEPQRPTAAAAALLLSYSSTAAAPQDELRLALLLAGHLSHVHGRELHSYGTQLHSTMHPIEDVQWGPGVDSQYPELPSSSSSSEEEGPSPIGGIDGRQGHGSGGAAASAARRGARDPQRAQLRRRRQRQLQESQPLREQAPASMEQQQLGQGQGLWGVDLSTLRFCKARTEQKYQRWRNIRLAPVDAVVLLALLAYSVAAAGGACPVPSLLDGVAGVGMDPLAAAAPAAAASASPVSPLACWCGALALPTLAVVLPLLLLLCFRDWYLLHREELLVGAYLVLVVHRTLHLPAQLAALPGSMWRTALGWEEGAWGVVLGTVLQVQFEWQGPMLGAAVVLRALAQPGCPTQLLRVAAAAGSGAAVAAAQCLPAGIFRSLVLQLLLPCWLAYYWELQVRRSFRHRSVAARPAL